MRRRQVAKGQSIRWKRDLRHLAAKEVSTALREQRTQYRVRPQAHEIRSVLESFLFWLSFIFFRAIRIVSVAALKAFHEEVDVSRSKRLSSTLPRGTTAGQNGRTHQDPAAVDDEDFVLSQGDPPSGVKKKVPSIKDMAVQVDHPKHAPVKVPSGQPSGTSSVKTTAIQADLPQRSPVTPRTNNPPQTKDMSRRDHLQAPKEAPDARNQQSTARDKIYVMVQPMPAPGTVGTPCFTEQNVSQFIEQYERLCVRHYMTSKEKHQGLPEYCDY